MNIDKSEWEFIPSGAAADPDPYELDDFGTKYENLYFVRDDMGNWSMSAGYQCYDWGFGRSAFHVPPQFQALLDEMHEVLSEDGR